MGAERHEKKELSRHKDDNTCTQYNLDCEATIEVIMNNPAPSIMKEYPHLSPFKNPLIIMGAVQSRFSGSVRTSIWEMAKEKVNTLAQTAGRYAY
jgi:hypothetical protein